MNNQNYNPQQPQQPPMPKQPKKSGGFDMKEFMPIIACTCSVTGFAMVLLSVAAGGIPVYGVILNIFALLLSAGGCFLSFVFGNQNIAAGKPRGTAATIGLIFGLAGVLIAIFAFFITGCNACNSCKSPEERAADAIVSAFK